MNRRTSYLAVTATEVFAGLSVNPRTLAVLANEDITTYHAAGRRALKRLLRSRTSHSRSHSSQYMHSCWVEAASN